MELRALQFEDMEQINQWRNSQQEMLRTPYALTEEMQIQFYKNVVCNRNARSRYWGICIESNAVDYNGEIEKELIGMAGLENIQWENRLAEISLITESDESLEEALRLILFEGFMNMNLENIFTEVYTCSPHFKFWKDMAEYWKCSKSGLPNRKYHLDTYWNSLYINFNKDDCLEYIISKPS